MYYRLDVANTFVTNHCAAVLAMFISFTKYFLVYKESDQSSFQFHVFIYFYIYNSICTGICFSTFSPTNHNISLMLWHPATHDCATSLLVSGWRLHPRDNFSAVKDVISHIAMEKRQGHAVNGFSVFTDRQACVSRLLTLFEYVICGLWKKCDLYMP